MHATLLVAIRRFIVLTPVEEDLVREGFVPETLAKGGFFLRPGEVSRKIGFGLQGVFPYVQRGDGQELTYYFGREPAFSGDCASFLSARPAAHGIQALEEAHLLTTSAGNPPRLYREVREGERFGRLLAAALSVDVVRQPTSFYEERPAQRYARFGRTYPDLQQRTPQHCIASCVGVQPLSRIRGRADL